MAEKDNERPFLPEHRLPNEARLEAFSSIPWWYIFKVLPYDYQPESEEETIVITTEKGEAVAQLAVRPGFEDEEFSFLTDLVTEINSAEEMLSSGLKDAMGPNFANLYMVLDGSEVADERARFEAKQQELEKTILARLKPKPFKLEKEPPVVLEDQYVKLQAELGDEQQTLQFFSGEGRDLDSLRERFAELSRQSADMSKTLAELATKLSGDLRQTGLAAFIMDGFTLMPENSIFQQSLKKLASVSRILKEIGVNPEAIRVAKRDLAQHLYLGQGEPPQLIELNGKQGEGAEAVEVRLEELYRMPWWQVVELFPYEYTPDSYEERVVPVLSRDKQLLGFIKSNEEEEVLKRFLPAIGTARGMLVPGLMHLLGNRLQVVEGNLFQLSKDQVEKQEEVARVRAVLTDFFKQIKVHQEEERLEVVRTFSKEEWQSKLEQLNTDVPMEMQIRDLAKQMGADLKPFFERLEDEVQGPIKADINVERRQTLEKQVAGMRTVLENLEEVASGNRLELRRYTSEQIISLE